jgi:hypothetical protein
MYWVKIIDTEENKSGVVLRTESNNYLKYQTSHIAIKNTWLEVNDIINKNWVKVNYFSQVTIQDGIFYEKLVLYLPLLVKGRIVAKLEKDVILCGKINIKPPTPLTLEPPETQRLTYENVSRLVGTKENNKFKTESDLNSESNFSTFELSEDKKHYLDIWMKNYIILDSLLITSYQNILDHFKLTKPSILNTRDITCFLKQTFEVIKISGKINYKGIGIRKEKEQIINNSIDEEDIKSVVYKKKNIPKHVKTLCWNLYIGEDKNSSKCVCCNSTTINITSFHCGHVIAEVNGGETNINNLRPVCSGCNLSMASMNMDDFIKMIRINLPEEDLLK